MADFDPYSLYDIKAILVLDQFGKRILAKYYDEQLFPADQQKSTFEEKVYQKTLKANAKVFVLDDLLCTFRSNIALFFYVVGGAQENELILKRVLNSLSEAFSEVLRKNIQRKLADESTNNSHWLECHKLLHRRKEKKQKQRIDTKASKGRRIRYVEISKLVNFFPATPERVPWSHEKRSELFKSLFI